MKRFRHCPMHFLGLLVFFIFGCTTAPSNTESRASYSHRSLPQEKLSLYSDTFDTLRDDLWERSQYTWKKAQMENFKLADIYIENGKLKFETKTGGFSKAGLQSRYYLRGDFDIQMDCHIDFLKRNLDMDQRVLFVVVEAGREMMEAYQSIILLRKSEGMLNGLLISGCLVLGRFNLGSKREIHNFHGTLRFRRIGKKVTGMYREMGMTEWKKLSTFWVTDRDMGVGFTLQNFDVERESIKAEASISALFDNYRINAAQGIREPEI